LSHSDHFGARKVGLKYGALAQAQTFCLQTELTYHEVGTVFSACCVVTDENCHGDEQG
jgi:hypothetical protein